MSEQAAIDVNAFKEFERSGWQDAVEGFTRLHLPTTAQAAGPLLDAVAAGPGTRLLDVASGPGELAAAAAARGAAATGVDFAAAMVAKARERHPDLEFREGDAEALPFEDGGFDAVTCSFGLLHFPEPDKAIAEAHRVLASGGRYAFTVWSTPDKVQYFGLVLGAVFEHGDPDVPLPAGPDVFRFSDPEECKRTLTAAGFVDAEARELPLSGTYTVEEVVESVYSGTVRTRAMVMAQEEDVRRRIDQAIVENVKPLEKDGRVELAMPAVMASGRKP